VLPHAHWASLLVLIVFRGHGVRAGREGRSVAPGSRRVTASHARPTPRSCMSSAGPGGPGHVDWRQGWAPPERRSV